jgi:two-component system KDP operon response regulator KdpE
MAPVRGAAVIGHTRILLVDDDLADVRLLEDDLHHDGFEVTVATTGAAAIAAIGRQWPDLVLLELALADMPGARVAAEIKRRGDLPILVLAAESEPATRTSAIEHFAEDYLTKPVYYPELRARIDRILRRLEGRIPAEVVEVGGGLSLALRHREATVDGRLVSLTPIEARLLGMLASTPGRVVSTDQLLARVWAGSDRADPVYVWVAMRRLRQKLEPDPSRPRFLHTGRRGGYRLGAPAAGERA